MDIPGRSGLLAPELYEREKEKFQVLMDETRKLATAALREEFAGIVRHIEEIPIIHAGENGGVSGSVRGPEPVRR